MISAAERRAKIQKLKADRERKEKELAELASQKATKAAASENSTTLIQTILEKTAEQTKKLDAEAAGMTKEQVDALNEAKKHKRRPLKISKFVVEMEIKPKPKPITYTRDFEVQCELITAQQAARLGRIDEEGGEDWENDFNDRFD